MADVESMLKHADRAMFVTVTDAHIEAAKSSRGGWSREQLALLSVDWPPQAGWKRSVVGRRVPGSVLASFIRLRDRHLPCPVADEQSKGEG